MRFKDRIFTRWRLEDELRELWARRPQRRWDVDPDDALLERVRLHNTSINAAQRAILVFDLETKRLMLEHEIEESRLALERFDS